jgi:hypothetical protein
MNNWRICWFFHTYINAIHGSRSKIPSKSLISQRCAEGFNFDFKGSTVKGSCGSSVSIATRFGLDGLGIESRCGRDFPHLPHRSCDPPSLLYDGYQVVHGGKMAGAWRWPPTSHLAAGIWKELSYTPTLPSETLVDCSRVNFNLSTFKRRSADCLFKDPVRTAL